MYLTPPSTIACYKIQLGVYLQISHNLYALFLFSFPNACYASTNAVIVPDLPLGSGIYFGGFSIASQYFSPNSSAELHENDVGYILGNLGSKYIAIFGFFSIKSNMWNT